MSSQSFKVTDSLYDNQRYESIKVEIFYVNNAHLNFEMSIFITFYTGGLRGVKDCQKRPSSALGGRFSFGNLDFFTYLCTQNQR